MDIFSLKNAQNNSKVNNHITILFLTLKLCSMVNVPVLQFLMSKVKDQMRCHLTFTDQTLLLFNVTAQLFKIEHSSSDCHNTALQHLFKIFSVSDTKS